MQDHINAIETALRILSAWNSRKPPERADVVALRSYTPDLSDLPPDDLACEVVERAVRACAAPHPELAARN